jgi:hypothetical protein
MKLKYVGALLMIISFFGCSKEMSYETPHQIGGGDTASFKAMINGVQWIAVDSLSGATILAGLINVTGISSDNKLVSITLVGSGTGTYTLNQSSASVLSYSDLNSSNTNPFTTSQGQDTSFAGGQVTVTAINTTKKTISGTFQCKVYRAQDSRQEIITQGIFNNIPYTDTLPKASQTDTFNVTIAGTPWVAPSISTSITPASPVNKLQIIGTTQDGSKLVGLIMPSNVAPGTYSTDLQQGTYSGVYIPTPGVTLLSDPSGSITILSNDTTGRRIRGDFQFPAFDLQGVNPTVLLTQGFFSVSY